MEFSKRQTEIIKAAVQIVSINGIQALTTKSLAEYIGISEPALYRHFKNKSEIIRAMLMQFDVDLESLRRKHSGWELVKAFFTYRIEQVMNERYWANIIFSEELFIHTSEYSELLKEMMHRHRNIIMENIVIASKNGVIRSDIAPEIVFRILAGSLRLLIKQYGMSGNAFDLCSESTILFNTWDTLFKVKNRKCPTRRYEMEEKMFCFQCQEACRNTGCTFAGMCGKKAETAHLMDEIIRQLKLIALSRKPDKKLGRFVIQSLFMTITNANFDNAALKKQLDRAIILTGDADIAFPSGVMACENEDIRSLRELLTYGLKGIAAYAEHAAVLGKEEESIYEFFFKALKATVTEENADNLTALVLEAGAVAVKTMALLDSANTENFGNPEITTVKTGVGNRPGILISGHDLLDMKELLEQSKDAGIDIYTHSEMLPAHYYPELKKYPHLYGNYGNAWHLQNKEFASFNGPILMTTNCITPVQDSYKDRIFTTGMAGYPGVPHIAGGKDGKPKDFSAVIELAKTCPPPEKLEDGTLTGGFAHAQVFALADKVVEAVKSGAIRRFVVMAGCDGRHKERSYYTEVAENLPKDTVILTAGCAKYRYNKLVTGDIGGIPRVLDAGQCNDCYSLAVIALKLKEVFGVKDINDLPISFDIAWYEQKAVAVLLALLHLGFKNLRLGPTLPAFLSPGVAAVLVKTFDIKGITDPQADINAMMSGK